jgi:hypothetical protein
MVMKLVTDFSGQKQRNSSTGGIKVLGAHYLLL